MIPDILHKQFENMAQQQLAIKIYNSSILQINEYDCGLKTFFCYHFKYSVRTKKFKMDKSTVIPVSCIKLANQIINEKLPIIGVIKKNNPTKKDTYSLDDNVLVVD